MELFYCIFAEHAGASQVGPVEPGNDLGTTGMQPNSSNSYYITTAGKLENVQTSGNQMYLYDPDTDINAGRIEIEIVPFAGTTVHTFVIVSRYHVTVPILFTGYGTTATLTGPGLTYNGSHSLTIPSTGWVCVLEQSEDASNLYVTGHIFARDGYEWGVSTALYSTPQQTISKSHADYHATGGIGLFARNGGTGNRTDALSIVAYDDQTDQPLTPLTLDTTATTTSITLSGSPSGGSGMYTMTLYSKSTCPTSDSPGTSAGTYTSGMTISSLSPASTRYYIVSVNDGTDTVWSNPVEARTFAAAPGIVVGVMGTSTYTSTDAAGRTAIDIAQQIISDIAGGTATPIEFVNASVGGTVIANWAPGQTNYANAVASFNSAGVTDIMIGLGMNDRYSTVGAYPINDLSTLMDSIISGLQADVPTLARIWLILIRWPNDANITRVFQMNDMFRTKANGTTVRICGEASYLVSKTRGAGYYDGSTTHPSDEGVVFVGMELASTFLDLVYDIGSQADAAAAQLATDVAEVEAVKGSILYTVSPLGVAGTYGTAQSLAEEIAGLISSGMTGANPIIVMTQDADGNPIPSVTFTVDGIGSGRTNESGELEIGLADGTWDISAAPANGVVFETVSVTVPGDTECILIGEAISITPPAVGQVTMWTVSRDSHGAILAGINIQHRIVSVTSKGTFEGVWVDSETAGDDGLIEITVPASSTCQFRKKSGGQLVETIAPASGTKEIDAILWKV